MLDITSSQALNLILHMKEAMSLIKIHESAPFSGAPAPLPVKPNLC